MLQAATLVSTSVLRAWTPVKIGYENDGEEKYTRRSGRFTGRSLSTRLSTSANTAVVAPTPSAITSTNAPVNAGARRNPRSAYVPSCHTLSSHGAIHCARASSRASVTLPMARRLAAAASAAPAWSSRCCASNRCVSSSSANSASMRRFRSR